MELVYEQQWATYEEYGGIKIYEDENGEFWYHTGGYSVYTSKDYWNDLERITGDEVLGLIDEWEDIAKEYEHYFD